MIRRLVVSALFLLSATAHAASLEKEMKTVERIRGLSFDRPVVQRTIARADLPKVLRAQMEKSMPYSADDYATILRALQLVDADKGNVVDKMIDLYQSQVLAFYDPLTHVYYAIDQLPAAAGDLGVASAALGDSVVVHELTHALQDQHFGAGARDVGLMKDTDGSLAFHALMEGEATLVMLASLLDDAGQKLDAVVANPEALSMMTGAMDAADKTVDPSIPRYFLDELKFPYAEGLKLCVEGYRRGGWKLLDRMNQNPPRSTREVLHPAEYFARLAAPQSTTRPFDDKTTVPHALTVEHLGEFHWRFLVGAPASAGWVDDRVVVAQNAACEPTVLADTRWESAARAATFRDAYVAFLRGRGIEPRSTVDGARVRVAYGADAKLAEAFVR